MSKELVSIAILTYNDAKFLEGCLRSIREQVSCPFEVILLDNGSSEPVPEGITEQYPWLRMFRSDKNLGFNAGYNLAARKARGKYLLVLNIDTILLTDIAPAVRLLASGLQIGVVGAKSYHPSGKPQPSAGHFPNARRLWLFRSQWWSNPRGIYGPTEVDAHRVDWVSGSFLMTTAENWATSGGFDEHTFYYGSDVNFCRSTSARGFAVVQCGEVKYIHFEGFRNRDIVSEVGNLYGGFRSYHRKFSGPVERLAAESVLRVGLVVRILLYGSWYGITRNPRIGDKFRAYVNVQRNWVRITS